MQPEYSPDHRYDERIIAIRKNDRVGVGTCTHISEAYTDQELVDILEDDNITDPDKAVECAIELEGMILEKALNQRWGEDDDPQLLAWKEWNDHKGGREGGDNA